MPRRNERRASHRFESRVAGLIATIRHLQRRQILIEQLDFADDYVTYESNYKAVAKQYAQDQGAQFLLDGSSKLQEKDFLQAMRDLAGLPNDVSDVMAYLESGRIFSLSTDGVARITRARIDAGKGPQFIAATDPNRALTGLNVAQWHAQTNDYAGHALVHEFEHTQWPGISDEDVIDHIARVHDGYWGS